MATKRPARRREPFVIEPLNWVAPDDARADSEKQVEQSRKTAPVKEPQE